MGETEGRRIEFHREDSEGGKNHSAAAAAAVGRTIMWRETFYSSRCKRRKRRRKGAALARARKPLTKPIKVEADKRRKRRGVTGDFTTIIRNGWAARPRQRMLFQSSQAEKEDAAIEQGKQVWTVSLSPLSIQSGSLKNSTCLPLDGRWPFWRARIVFLPRSFPFFAPMVRIGWSEFAN